MRRLIEFPCAGEMLLGTLDEGNQRTGLLIVSGGNEIRIGAHRGMASLAARLAARGFPVFRFDRRGIGDSSGLNGGFESSAPDIAAAAATFCAETGVTRLVAFGNCDAATALALFHNAASIDALVLANPWAVEDDGDTLPPAAAIRARYAEQLRSPREWLRLLRGGVDLGKAVRGLVKAARSPGIAPDGLTSRLAKALNDVAIPMTILLADRDNTAVAFHAAWKTPAFALARGKAAVAALASANHSFATASDSDWLADQLLKVLK